MLQTYRDDPASAAQIQLIIDEVTMVERNLFLAIDRTLQEIRGNDKPFGGITIVVSGDWRQTLPVIPRANRAHLVSETLKGNNSIECFYFQVLNVFILL